MKGPIFHRYFRNAGILVLVLLLWMPCSLKRDIRQALEIPLQTKIQKTGAAGCLVQTGGKTRTPGAELRIPMLPRMPHFPADRKVKVYLSGFHPDKPVTVAPASELMQRFKLHQSYLI